MLCCPESRVTKTKSPEIKPRFPQANGQPRPVEDKTPFCERWKNHGACRQDQTFKLNSKIETTSVYILSSEMFPFMMSACMNACGWGKRVRPIVKEGMRNPEHNPFQGCVDEHFNCPKWARLGLCSTGNALGFMAHTCRESCGVCGFLSPLNNETQVRLQQALATTLVSFQEVGGASYTNIKDRNFDCGRYKNYCDIQEDCTAEDLTQGIDGTPRNVTDGGWGYEEEITDGCGITLINDRFAVSAGHCFKTYGGPTQLFSGGGITIR